MLYTNKLCVDDLNGGQMKIMISDILRIEEPTQYKLHLACRNEQYENPLDIYVASHLDWVAWNEWKGNKDDWTREYIFSLMEFYPRKDSWLFGGIFRVLDRAGDKYNLDKVADFEKFTGRLIVSFHRYQGMRGRAYYLENYLDQFEVMEILPQPYSGEAFCGHENIDHDFNVLEAIFKTERGDWKSALSNIKGVYLIFDKSNGRKYVGSAYGDGGIWSRWACYIGTGHGWNDELTKLINEYGIEYARNNFKFSLLEVMTMKASEDTIRMRESYWKRVLLTTKYGYNKN